MPNKMLPYSNIGPETGCSVRLALLALSTGMLGTALQITDGLYSPVGIIVLTLSFAFCLLAVLGPDRIAGKALPFHKLNTFIGTLVALQLLEMLMERSGASEATVPQVAHDFFNSCVLIAIVGLTLILFGHPRSAMKGFVLMLMMFVLMGIWKIRTAPSPLIDVFVFHRDAADALAHGQNPYAITFPDIYGQKGNWVYGQGVAKDGRLQFGYPYPPLTLLMTAAAKLSLGDARYAMLAAMLASGIMIYLIRPDRIGMLAAVLLLFTPRSFYVLESAWTEPLSVMLLTATILCAKRSSCSSSPSTPGEGAGEGSSSNSNDYAMSQKNPHPKPLPDYREGGQSARWTIYNWLTPICFGLLIASKQYLPATIALLPLMISPLDRKFAKFLIIAFLATSIVTLPFALWNFHAFWDSVVALQLRQPYRADSLGYLAWWGFGRSGWRGPFWVCFVSMIVAIGRCYKRVRPGVEGFVCAMTLSFFAFFAFNKQAFANYYYLVLGAMCCAIVAGVTHNRTKSWPISS
jgi:hypothetical protein